MAGSTRNPWEENYSTEGDSASGAKPWEQSYQEPEKPKPRNLAAVANDTAIEVANAAAGGVSAAANFVKPGNAVSGWIDKNIVKAGEDAQSDVTKAAKQQFRQDVESADGVMGELGAVGRYVVENPLLSAAQAAGSFVGPGVAVKAAGFAGKAAQLGAKGVERAGRAGGVAAGAAMAGGDAAGTAYELSTKAGATEDQAVAAGRQASVIPAVIGGVGGMFGAEKLLAGAKGFAGGATSRALKTGASEAVQEGIEEGATQYEGQRAAMPYDPSIDPSKGVAAAAGMGAALGGITGAGASLLTGRDTGQQPNPGTQTPPGQTQPAPAAGPTLALPAPERGVIQVGPDGTARTPTYQPPGYVGDVTDVEPRAIDPVRAAVESAANEGGALSDAALTAIDSGASSAMQSVAPDAAPPAPISLEEADARDQAAYEQFFSSVESDSTVGRYFENDNDIPDFDAASNVSDEDFLRSLGATDEDIQDAIATASQPTISQSGPAVDAGPQAYEPAGTRQGAGADQAAQGQVDAGAIQQPAPAAPVPALGGPVGADGAAGPTPAVSDGLAAGGPGNGGAAAAGVGAAEPGAARPGGRGDGNPALTPFQQARAEIQARKQQEAANAQAAAQSAPTSAPAVSTARPGAVEAAGLNRPKSTRKAAEFDARKAAEIEAGALGAQEAEAAGVPTQVTWLAHRKWVYSQAPRMTLREFQVALKGRHGMSGPEIEAYYKSSNGGAEVSAAKITTEGTANVPQADQAQQTATQPTQAGAAQPTQGLTDAAAAQNPGAQAAPAPGAQGAAPAESAEQRTQRVAAAGEAWTRMPAAQREALAGIAAGLNPIQRKRVPSAAWADLNRTIQRNLADAMGTRSEFGGNQAGTSVNTAPVAINSEADQIAEAVSKADRLDLKGAERAQWVHESLSGVWGMTPDEVRDVPAVAAALKKKPSKDDSTAASVRAVEQVVRQAEQAVAPANQAPEATENVASNSTGQDEKARWLKSVADMNRMSGKFGAQIDGVTNGRLSVVGNPNATKQGRALMAAVDEARRAGATNEEIAQAAAGRATAAPQGIAPAPAQETTYNGTRIYPTKVKVGDEVKSMWAAESPDNQRRRAAGERTIGGDSLHDTLEQAQAAAKREAKRDAAQQAAKAEQDAADKVRLDAEEARKAANRPKTLMEHRKDAVLSKQVLDSETGNVMTRREWVENKVADGLKTSITQEDKIKPMSRRQIFRADNLQQAEHDRKVKEAGKKDVYWLGDFEVTKIEYDYAQELKAQREAAPQAVESPALQAAMGAAGWTGETGQGDTIWTKRANGERYTALLWPDAGSMEVTVLADGVDTQIASFKVGDAKAAAEAANKAVAQDVAEQSPADDTLPNGWTKSVNGYTKRPVYRMEQGGGQPFAVVTQDTIGRAMGDTEKFGENQPVAPATQAQPAIENVASTQPAKEFTGTKKGDFYEVEGDNAKEAARILDLTLTKSRAGVPIVGWPYHAHERNVAKLAESGISFKMEDPATHKDAGESPEAAAQQVADDFLPEGWTKSVNGYTKRPVYRMEQGGGQPFAKPDALTEREKAAKAKMLGALGKLAALASKNTRMNWTPEEEQKLLPIVIELFDGAIELGAVTFQKAVAYVRDFIAQGIDQETADAIPFETLQGAYIAVAGRHKDKGVTAKKEVAGFDSLEELQAVVEPEPTTIADADKKADTDTKDAQNANPDTTTEPGQPTVSAGPGIQDGKPRKVRGNAGGVRGSNSKPASGNAGRGPNENAGTDYVPGPEGLTRTGSWFETAKRNIDLIELAIKIDSEKRPATPQEQEQLAKYVGFGASAIRNDLFPIPGDYAKRQEPNRLIWPNLVREARWKPLAERIDALPREWQQSILQSSQYAHYTSEGIIRSVWGALDRMGFKGGNVFEPGMGIGSFAMLMPNDVRADSRYTGIEFDAPTALIAGLLSPQQNMIHGDFIQRKFPKNFFDVNVGNPPFAPTKIYGDPDYAKNGFFLHDFFFAKGIDLVRPGGIQVFVTSKGTMDKQSDKARKYLSERADLLGAIRLPSTAFEGNAGTSVVTDVIFLKKRAPGEAPGGHPWSKVATVETPDGPVVVNEYFAANPHMVLGQQRISGNVDDEGRRINSNGQGGEKYTVVSYDKTPAELDAKFAAAVKNLPAGAYSPPTESQAKAKPKAVDFDPAIKREGVIYLGKDGSLMRVDEGIGKNLAGMVNLSEKEQAWFKSYVGLRDKVQAARFDQLNDGPWEKSLASLNKAYDDFRKEHGPVKDFRIMVRKSTDEDGKIIGTESRIFKNRKLYREDYDSALITSLEEITEDGDIVKAPFLKGRTIGKPVERVVRSIGDALAVSLDEIGSLSLEDVGRRLDLSREEAIEALGSQVYQAPTGEWQLADEYLSGDVVAKLEEAEQAAQLQPELRRNVDALKAVQPEKLGPSQISAKLGASWIPESHVNEFATEIGAGAVTFDPRTETWQVSGGNLRSQRTAGDEYGTAARSPSELLEAVLNSRSIKVAYDSKDGKDLAGKVNPAATTAANEMAKKIKDKFKGWVWTDTDRSTELVERYNKQFNNIAPRRFDGSHLTLPGVSLRFKLHPHQLRAIWRMVQTGNTYLAHAVGAGKTIEMIAGGMEQKRLGLIKKPIYVVPNHMLEQFSNEFMELYPMANIMVADDENFSPERRKAFVAAATLNNPDAIVITHDAFQRIGVKEESVAPIRDEILADLEIELSETAKSNDARVRRGQLEQQIEAVKQRFDRIIGAGAKDSTVKFEDMGVDFVFADEAHVFRKLDFHTAQQIKGIDPNGSKRALDMYVKTRILDSRKPGRSMVFASGTPVTNTMGELYTIMRFFAGDALDKAGISTFDAWARQFGEVAPALEPNAAGKYELIERFAKFDNVPELMSRVRQFMDVLTSDNLGALVKRPDIKGGKPNLNITAPNKALQEYMKGELARRIEISKAWKPSKDEPNNPDPIVAIITDGRFAALDPRFFGGKLEEGETSLLMDMGKGVVESYHATKDNVYQDKAGKDEPIKGSTQLVFYNLGFGEQSQKNRGFNSRAAFTKILTDGGIPRSEIYWFDDANTDAKKEAVFKDVRNGKVKVLIGSAKKMGTGVNVQKRLAVLHYQDPPWFPADVEQPHGRIIRQGNQNAEGAIEWYTTKGTYQSTMWQMVGRKQRFIDQAFTGDKNLRSMDDLGEASLFEQAAAVASGDPRAIQLAGLRQDVERFERLQASHSSEQINVASSLRSAQWGVDRAKKRIATYTKAFAAIGERYFDFSEGKVGNATYTKPGEFGQAIKDAFNKTAADAVMAEKPVKDKPIAAIGDAITIYMDEGVSEGKGDGQFELSVSFGGMNLGMGVSSGMGADVDATGLARRIFNQINSVDQDLRRAKEDLVRDEVDVNKLRKKLGAPFEYQQEMAEKYAELKRLEAELRAEGAAPATPAKAAITTDDTIDEDAAPLADGEALILSATEFAERFGSASFKDGFAVVAPGGFSYRNQPSGVFETREAAATWIASQSARPAGPAAIYSSADSTLPAKPLTLDRVNQLVQEALSGIRGAPPVEVTARPGDIGLRVPAGSVGYGVTLRSGDIYVFQSAMGSDLDVFKTVFHELFHRGVRVLLPKGQYVQTMLDLAKGDSRIQQLAIEWKNTEMGQKQKDNLRQQGYTGAELTGQYEALAIEEALAAVAEEIKAEGRIGSKPKSMTIRFLSNWLAKVADLAGMKKLAQGIRTMTYNEAERFVMSAISRSGEPVQAGRTDNMSSKQAAPGTDQTQTEAFKRWFAGSKVVDADGKPLVAYHGTIKSFDAFDQNAEPFSYESDRGKQFFLDNPIGASDYAIGTSDAYGGNANVMPVYLRMENPRIEEVDGPPSEWWDENGDGLYWELDVSGSGHDGLIVRGDGETMYVTANPNQIKSATGNNGNFDPANADIRFRSADMGSRAGMSALASKARDELNRTFAAPGKLSFWHKTVGTMYNLAERSPAFKPVFNAAQGFVDDVSYYATDAAELAPKLLPKLETWRDIAKRPISAADNAAVAKPVFEGTLDWARDDSGKPVRLQTLMDAAEKLTPEQKAQRLLRQNKISEGMLKAWQGLPLEQYEKLVASRYESQMLQAGIVWTPAELKAQFKLNDAQVELYQEFRAATNRSLDTMARSDMLRFGGEDVKDLADMVMDAKDAQDAAQILRDHLQMLAKENPDRAGAIGQLANGMLDRAARVQELQEQGYAPLSRFGKYTVDVVNADGKREYFGLFETAREANIMAMKMRKGFGQDAVTQGTLSDEEFKLLAGITPESLELFGNMLGLDATGDDAQDQAFQEYLRRTKTNRSAMRRLIHRQGIAGYSEDVGRVLASFIYSNSRQTSAGLHMGDLGEAITAIPKQQGELKDAAIQLSEYVKNPREEAQAVRGLLFAQYLGGSIASAMVNMSQPAAVTFPWLAQFGGAKQAAAELGRAAKNLASRGHRFEADLTAALKHAEEEGTVSPQEVHQLMAQAQGSGSLRPGDGTRSGDARAAAGNALTRLSLAWGKVFGAAEQVNRRMTFIAAYRVAKAQKMANPAAFAKKAVVETQFTYSKANKMKWGRGAVGATAMTFKTYSIAYLELLGRMWTQGGPEGKKAVLLALGMLMLMGGAGGLPFAEDAEDLADGIAQMAGYNINSKKAKQELLESLFGEAGAGFVERGITGLPGMPLDVSGRLGMGNLLPATGLFKEKTDHTRDVLEIVGPVGDLAKRAVSGARSVLTGDVGAGLLQMAPAAVRNAAKGSDMWARDMYRDDKGYKVIDTTLAEAAMKAIGFQPASVSKVQESNYINQQAKNFYNLQAQEIRAKWARGIFEKNTELVAEARTDLEDWNRRNPDQRIVVSMPAVLKRVREMGKSKDERIAATAPKAMRQQMREDAAKARAAL